jgi:hypothetical protein
MAGTKRKVSPRPPARNGRPQDSRPDPAGPNPYPPPTGQMRGGEGRNWTRGRQHDPRRHKQGQESSDQTWSGKISPARALGGHPPAATERRDGRAAGEDHGNASKGRTSRAPAAPKSRNESGLWIWAGFGSERGKAWRQSCLMVDPETFGRGPTATAAEAGGSGGGGWPVVGAGGGGGGGSPGSP